MRTASRFSPIALSIAAVFGFFCPAAARADQVKLNFSFLPARVMVVEFAPGAVKVTITNPNAFPVQIDCIDNWGNCGGAPAPPGFVYFDHDPLDQPLNAVDDVTNCKDAKGNLLSLGASGGTCNYKINFDTTDSDVAKSGTNFGRWYLSTLVLFSYVDHGVTTPGASSDRLFVYVLDPHASIPEPGTLALLVGGIAGIVARCRYKGR